MNYLYSEINNLSNVENVSGIYYIEINNKGYVGSTRTLRNRLLAHKNGLLSGKHHSKKLQRAYNKYGCYKMFILCTCPEEYLLKLEQWFMDKEDFNTFYCGRLKADRNTGVKYSEEAKKKMKDHMNKPENKNRLGDMYRGKKRSKEQIEKMAASLRGKKQSEESKQKKREAWNKFKETEEYQIWVEDVKKRMTGKKLTESQRKEISDRMKNREVSQETKDKLSRQKLGKKLNISPDFKNPYRALSDEIVIQIKQDIKNGIGNIEICEKYNVKMHIFIDIKRGRSYKNTN